MVPVKSVGFVLCVIALACLGGCGGGDTSPNSGRGSSDKSSGGGASSGGGGDTGGSGGASSSDGFGNTNAMAQDLAPISGDGGSALGDGGLPPDQEGNCGGVEVTPDIKMEKVPGNLLIIFDKSGSMDRDWNGLGEKWTLASNALVAGLTPLAADVTAGAIFYPQTSSCDVATIDSGLQIDFMPGMDFVNAWNAFMMSNNPNGSTPLGTATAVADQALVARLPNLVGITNVVLLTDGEPNCSTNESQVQTIVANWLTMGVQTHVVGLPGSNGAAATLDAIAAAGGTGTHITPEDPTVLEAKLAQIVSESVSTNFDSCSIGIDNAPPNLDDVNLVVIQAGQKKQVPRDLGASGGWTIRPDGSEIILQGVFCDKAKEGEYDQISVVFGCVELPPLPPPPPPE
ncbi:MAG: VWA domain-containing protein [Myxococcales bacterium]|nr:VWA domain-containing protein [Myxococcales bacterium]